MKKRFKTKRDGNWTKVQAVCPINEYNRTIEHTIHEFGGTDKGHAMAKRYVKLLNEAVEKFYKEVQEQL